MADLEIDERLKELFKDLLSASIAFTSADYTSRTVADAVGHHDLAAKVHDFATKWDDRRPKITSSVDALWKSAQVIDKTFGDIDKKMGAQLAQKG